jgi:hypothetical protein
MTDEPNPYLVNPRWSLAERVSEAARRRYPADVLAVGVYGSLAHGDDTDSSDVNLLVATYRPGTGPRPGVRRVDGVLVDLDVAAADDHLRQARTLTSEWPLRADRYLSARPVLDPTGWLPALRDAHLGHLAAASAREFSALARDAWGRAAGAHARAGRLAEWYATDAALLLLGQARLTAAMVTGLLSRTYFRNSADAVQRTGLASADMTELGGILRDQADELARRGRPVDARPNDLFD